jgi:hypothetical protein
VFQRNTLPPSSELISAIGCKLVSPLIVIATTENTVFWGYYSTSEFSSEEAVCPLKHRYPLTNSHGAPTQKTFTNICSVVHVFVGL